MQYSKSKYSLQSSVIKELSTKTLRTALLMISSVTLIGIWGFMHFESYSLTEALYMTIITISTVGFGEVRELSDDGRIFTCFLIVISFASIAYTGYVARFFFDGEFNKQLRIYRLEKKVRKLHDHVIVCGYGRNGEQVCKELREHNTPFVVIERRENVIERMIQDPSIQYVRGDAVQEEILKMANIEKAKALIATTPNDADNVFVTLTARSLNPHIKIISRAIEVSSDMKLKRAGVDNVIMPERIGGQRMAKLVTQPDIVEFVEYVLLQEATDAYIEEVSCKKMAQCFDGKPLAHLRQRIVTGANIIGIRNSEGAYTVNPPNDYFLEPGDQLFVLGSPEQLKKLRQVLENGEWGY